MTSISGNMLVGILILVVVLILILLVVQVRKNTVHWEQPSTHKEETKHVKVIDDEFMMEHAEWRIAAHYTDSHGLLVLKRTP